MTEHPHSFTTSLLEEHLQAILNQVDSKNWTIQSLFYELKGRGYAFLIILLSLPFCQPLQLPGFSTPFGLIVIFIGLRMLFGKHLWWPQWILKRQISSRTLRTIVQKSLWFIRLLKPFLHVRWRRLCVDPILYRFHGGFIALMGLYLALPLPIPFSNIVVAWALLLLGLGLMEDDGLFICLGYGMGCLGFVALAFLFFWIFNGFSSY